MSHEKTLCFRFNRKPKKGVQFLQEQRLLGNTSAEIAEWLYTNDRLDKTGVGDFLGDSDDLSKEVRLLKNHTVLYNQICLHIFQLSEYYTFPEEMHGLCLGYVCICGSDGFWQ